MRSMLAALEEVTRRERGRCEFETIDTFVLIRVYPLTVTMPTALIERIKQAAHEQECTCLNLRKATRAVTQLYDEALRSAGLRVTQFSLLAMTKAQEPVTVTKLAEALVMDRTTLTRNLKLLEKQNLVRIAPGVDRREHKISLTATGTRTLAAAFPLWETAQARLADGLGPDRLQRLLTDLSAAVALKRAR